MNQTARHITATIAFRVLIVVALLLLTMVTARADDFYFLNWSDDRIAEILPDAQLCNAPLPRPRITPGEWVLFEGRYLGIKAGYVSIQCTGIQDIDGRPAYHIQAYAWTEGFYRGVYQTDNSMETWVDVETMQVVRAEQHWHTRREYDWRTWRFRHDACEVDRVRYANDFRRDSEREYITTIPIEPNVVEEMLSMYLMRSWPCGEGSVKPLTVFHNRKHYRVAIHNLGRSKVSVPAGEFRCNVYEPIAYDGPEDKIRKTGKLEIYFSDDERALPVKIKAKSWLGTAYFNLKAYGGLAKLTQK